MVHALFSQDGCRREGFQEVVGQVVSPFDLSRTLLVGGLLFLFLTRTSCCKTTHANSYYGAWPGWAVSISVLPLTLLDFWWIQESFSPGTCYGSVWCVSRCSGAGWCGEAVLWFSRKSWVSRTLISGLALPCTSFLQWSRATLLIAVNSSSMKQWY